MVDPIIPFVMAGSAAFGIGIMTLVFRIRRYTPARPWSDFRDRSAIRDQQYRDRIAANNDKPVGQFVEWPEVTEEQVINLYHGERQ